MSTLELKTNLHRLIDSINNESLLVNLYSLLDSLPHNREGGLWSRLSIEEQDELLLIEKESHEPENLIPHSEMIKKHSKWL